MQEKSRPYSRLRSETWLSLGLAFVGGYADAASYTLAGTFTGHITGNSVPNRELFIIFMCLALGLQNGALRKADGISVHTTYVTGMVTKLLEHEVDRLDFGPHP